jgi:hypothetical protein
MQYIEVEVDAGANSDMPALCMFDAREKHSDVT